MGGLGEVQYRVIHGLKSNWKGAEHFWGLIVGLCLTSSGQDTRRGCTLFYREGKCWAERSLLRFSKCKGKCKILSRINTVTSAGWGLNLWTACVPAESCGG